MSGRWDPPIIGWLEMMESPGLKLPNYAITASLMLPRWTGRWGALATRFPNLSKRAQEKSNLSFILILIAVFSNYFPISSAIAINLLENNDNYSKSLA